MKRQDYFLVGYLVFGVLLSQMTHLSLYKNSDVLESWFNWIVTDDSGFPVHRAVLFYLLLALVWYGVGILFLHATRNSTAATIGKLGIVYWVIAVISSQLISSSVMRLVDESSFFILFLSHLLVSRIFLKTAVEFSKSEQVYKELWDLLRILIPIAVAVPVIVGGGGLITSFYKDEIEFLRWQIYRQFSVAIYLEIGILLLLIWPVFKIIIHNREHLLKLETKHLSSQRLNRPVSQKKSKSKS